MAKLKVLYKSRLVRAKLSSSYASQSSKIKGAEHFTPSHTGEGWDGVSSSLIPLRFPQRIDNQPHLIGSEGLAMRSESATLQSVAQFVVALNPHL